MQLEDAIKIRIKYYLKKNNMDSLWELYKTSGVPKSTINALLSTNKSSVPKLATLLHICEGLNTTLKDFFNDDIFLDVEDITEDLNSK